jgi:hypothetical protein
MMAATLTIGMAIVPWRVSLPLVCMISTYSLAAALITVGCLGWIVIITRSIRNA